MRAAEITTAISRLLLMFTDRRLAASEHAFAKLLRRPDWPL